jgi:hypothetical protein
MSIPDKDYSNTIIYKITCKDPNIQDVYVGHTVNFVQRKKSHQLSCMNSKYPNHNCKVYKVIRNNGGWDNWNMGIIAFYNCNNLNEARQKEQEHFIALNATMNSVEPFPSKSVNRVKRVKCVKCVKRVRPIGSNTMMTNGKKRVYICEKCDFICSKQSIYNKHLETTKHKTNRYIIPTAPHSNNIGYVCPYCLKSYKYHSGIWRHKKECKHNNSYLQDDEDGESDEHDDHTLLQTDNVITRNKVNNCQRTIDKQIKNLTAENRQMKIEMARMTTIISNISQFQLQVLEMMKTQQSLQVSNTTPATTPATPPSSTTNNHSFNMNRFLNEKCKYAMNMTDFVNSIQLNLTDLENVERDGYVKGMSNILIDNLQKLDVCDRPVHCSDAKRETLYVRDDNQWERDGPNHPKMANAVRALEKKNEALIEEWANQHPNCMNDGTRENKRYLKISNAISLGNIAKVIKRVAKNVAIDKDAPPPHPADTA